MFSSSYLDFSKLKYKHKFYDEEDTSNEASLRVVARKIISLVDDK